VGGGLQLGKQLIAPAALGQGGPEAGLARASCAAPATSMLVAGSSSPEAASSRATELRRTSAASSAARAVSTRACSRSSRPARQDTYTPSRIAAVMMRTTVSGPMAPP